MKKVFKIIDSCTGKSYPATLVKETKCYYVVTAKTVVGKDTEIEHRFHKNTMYIDWQHLSLIIEEVLEHKSECTHDEYYAQFVSSAEINKLKSQGMLESIQKCTCPNFSSGRVGRFELKHWDNLPLFSHTSSKIGQVQTFVSLSDTVCIYKQAARMLRDEFLKGAK